MHMKTILSFLVALLVSSECMAQQKTARETFEQLGTRIDEIQQALGAWSAGPMGAGTMEKAVKTLESIVVDFQGNEWVQVKSFKIRLGFPPNIDIDFEVPQHPAAASVAR
jgi:hypothetical protein